MAYGISDYVEPVDGFRITSNTGYRKPPKTKTGVGSGKHHGTDYAPPTPGQKGVPIKNVSAGVVVKTGTVRGYGNYVIVKNNQGDYIQYSHLASYSVKPGQQVKAGEPIAVMGSTGNSSREHLDMTVVRNGKTIKRDGTVFANAPNFLASVANANGGNITPQATQTGEDPQVAGANPTVLAGVNGSFNVSDTPKEHELFSGIANMGLNGGLESIYATAAKAVADIWNKTESNPLFKTDSPLYNEVDNIFGLIEV